MQIVAGTVQPAVVHMQLATPFSRPEVVHTQLVDKILWPRVSPNQLDARNVRPNGFQRRALARDSHLVATAPNSLDNILIIQ